MGRYTLFNDYLFKHPTSPQPDNHVEVLKEIKNLGKDDDRVLVPALFYLGSERGKSARSENDTSLTPGNIFRMIELTHLLKLLQGHKYNIYETCFLDIGSPLAAATAAGSLISQILLLFILVYYNIRDITNGVTLSKDWGTILVAYNTTFFLCVLVTKHFKDASDFNAVLGKGKISSRFMSPLLWINIFVNRFLGYVIISFNFFFLLNSEDVNEAILNSLALFFILEIDDAFYMDADNDWYDNAISENLLHYIKSDGGGVDIHVDMVLPPAASEEDCYSHLLESDDKVYLKTTDDNDQLVVKLHWRRSPIRYDTVQFHISGTSRREFFDSIKEFDCLKKC